MEQRLTRRSLLAGGTAALSGCARRPAGPLPLVSILRAPHYGQDLYESCRWILREHKLDVRGKRVLLKPNLVEYPDGAPVNTHPLLVHAVLEALRSHGASAVVIGEGPANRRDALEIAEAAGYLSAIPHFEANFVDLNYDDVARVTLRGSASRLQQFYLPVTALNCDLIVSLPKMKTHRWAGATLSMKNYFGLVPGAIYGWPKNSLHWAGIDACVVDLCRLFPRSFAIVDGIEAMEGYGPIQGTSKHVGVLVAGANLPAVDGTACRIMGIDPKRIGYLSHFREIDDDGSCLIGEAPASVRTQFKVPPGMEGLLA